MRIGGLSLAVLAAALALAGCGGSTTSTTSGAPGAPSQAAFAQFRTCLAQHGVKAPSGGGPPAGGPPTGQPPGSGQPPAGFGGAPSKKMQRALQACRQYAPRPPGGGFVPPSG
jgi:hypothetical protein